MRAAVPALVAALALVLAGCRDANVERHDTSVLGGYGSPVDRSTAAPTLSDAGGQTIPAPPVPAGVRPQMVRSGDEAALAVWQQGGDVFASSWTRATGWTAAQPLESIHGESTGPQLASNGRGQAMAVWHHQVGNIHSLRFSRFEAARGWSVPDVLPGAMPRPEVVGAPPGQNGPRLQMDADGNVLAEWPSGFHANEMQVARYSVGGGWTQATSEPVAAAPAAAAGPAAASAPPDASATR
jgi:hypothetical protein